MENNNNKQTKVFIFFKTWSFYNALIDKDMIHDYIKEVKRQTGALRLHSRIVE